jgi:hypothetical protein
MDITSLLNDKSIKPKEENASIEKIHTTALKKVKGLTVQKVMEQNL